MVLYIYIYIYILRFRVETFSKYTKVIERLLYNEQRKPRVLIGLEECVIRVLSPGQTAYDSQ